MGGATSCRYERTSVSAKLLAALTDEDASDLSSLLQQLSTTATFDNSRANAMLDHDATEMIVARAGGRIVGMATLVTFPLPSGLRGHGEDMVVDSSMQGRGVARLLLARMTELASERGLRTLGGP